MPPLLGFGVPASPVLSALRLATADLHEAIELSADIEGRLRDDGSRAHTVSRFLALHEAVEHGIAPWRDVIAGAGYAPSSRAGLIRRDLAVLGQPAIATTSGSATVATLGQALGWIYVAEGSMLGGRIMRRNMTADGVSLRGLDFLDPYGDETGARWRAFLTTMESLCASGQAAQGEVIAGGRDAFTLASQVLVPTRPPETRL